MATYQATSPRWSWNAAVALPLGLLLAFAVPSGAIVLHDNASPSDTPPRDAVGRFASNASCVVVRPNWIVTTRHQGGGNVNVVIDGTTYRVVETVTAPDDADLRACRLETLDGQPANLDTFVQLYVGTDEVGKDVVLGGVGRIRGAPVMDNGIIVGYAWGGSNDNANGVRFGTNRVDQVLDSIDVGMFNIEALVVDFDPPGAVGSTDFESAAAFFDSGGGLFIKQDGQWRLAGLMSAVETNGSSIFTPADRNFFVRLSSYADFLDATLPIVVEPTAPAATATATTDDDGEMPMGGPCGIGVGSVGVLALAAFMLVGRASRR